MGTGYMLHCPQCNYQTLFFLGIGFAYPLVYAETQEKGNRGELGEDIKEFFSEHPDGVIDPVPAIEKTKTNADTRKIPMTDDVCRCFAAILEDRQAPAVEPIIGGRTGVLFYDKQGMPEVAMHWEHRFKHARQRYNEIYREQLPPVTPHICRHTYCSNMARAGMNPKTLQYLMGHSDISVTMNTYTHLGLEDAEAELRRVAESQAAREELEKLSGKEHSVIKFSREA